MSDKDKIETINKLRGVTIGLAATVSLSPAPVNAQEQTHINNETSSNKITLTAQPTEASIDTTNTIDFMEAAASVEQNAPQINMDNAQIGNLNYITCFFNSATGNVDKQQTDSKRPEIERIDSSNENYAAGANAYYSHHEEKIYMQNINHDISDNLSDYLHKQEMGIMADYRNGNPVALNAIAQHELTHWRNDNFSGMENLKYPSDVYRYDRVNEKMATTVEYLNIANQYSILKQQGIESIEFNGEKVSTESLLEFYPGLKDYITENGFSADNKKDIKNITQIACDYWEKECAQGVYQEQSYNATLAYSGVENLFEVTGNDKKTYDKVVNNMLENVPIGNNTYVDLPRDIIDNFSHEQTMEALNNQAVYGELCPITYQEVNKLNQYYESMGIKDNAQKQEQLLADFENIVNRRTENNGLLSALANKGSVSITYADGVTEEKGLTTEYAKDNTYAKINNLRNGLSSNHSSEHNKIKQNTLDISNQLYNSDRQY